MHELSIAIKVLEIAKRGMVRQAGMELVAIHLQIGPLAGVVVESLQSAYEIARLQSSFPDAELRIEQTELTIDCPRCRSVQPVVAVNDLHCRRCGELSGKIVGGRELDIISLEVMPCPSRHA